MELDKLSKKELLEKCQEIGFTKCKSKNKNQLIDLINKINDKLKIKVCDNNKSEIIDNNNDNDNNDNNINNINSNNPYYYDEDGVIIEIIDEPEIEMISNNSDN